jgi:DNA-binding NtrC family response regulator
LTAVKRHSFPGNVRELRNIVEQSTIMATGTVVELNDLPGYLRGERAAPPMPGTLAPHDLPGALPSMTPSTADQPPESLTEILEDDPTKWDYKELKERVLRRFEDQYLDSLLGLTGGNVTKAAELAGVHRVNLHRMIKRRESGTESSDEA